jgi:hypothetical protein
MQVLTPAMMAEFEISEPVVVMMTCDLQDKKN